METNKDLKKAISKMGMNAISKALNKCALQHVTCNNLEINKCVIDSEQNKGKIINIDDLHNVEIEFDNGSSALFCFVDGCDENLKDMQDLFFYC